jgi:hypothetical protein
LFVGLLTTIPFVLVTFCFKASLLIIQLTVAFSMLILVPVLALLVLKPLTERLVGGEIHL